MIEKIKALSVQKKVFYGLALATVIVGGIWTIRKISEQKPKKDKSKKK